MQAIASGEAEVYSAYRSLSTCYGLATMQLCKNCDLYFGFRGSKRIGRLSVTKD